MFLVRFFLIVALTLSASLSGAMTASHADFSEPDHEVMEMDTDHRMPCCDTGPERAPSCHVLIAYLPVADLRQAAPSAGEAVFAATYHLPTGFKPSGPLDPPRTV